MTSIESEFSVAIDLFEDLKSSECGHRLEIDYYAKVKEMEFVVHCNRYSCSHNNGKACIIFTGKNRQRR